MSKLSLGSAAEGYKQASISVQRTSGEKFIECDVCPQPGDAILDLGCGTGELSAYLAELVGPEGKVIGVDPDEQRIKVARQSHGKIKNLSFVDGSASNISEIFPESFDIIFSNYVLHWIADKQEAFHNMFASLKLGGKIAIQYLSHLPPVDINAFSELNPENFDRICGMFHCESREKTEQYCISAGFEMCKSFQANPPKRKRIFEDTKSLLEWYWSTTHGVFDPSLVTEERLQRYLAPYTDNSGVISVDFEIKSDEGAFWRVIAKKERSYKVNANLIAGQ